MEDAVISPEQIALEKEWAEQERRENEIYTRWIAATQVRLVSHGLSDDLALRMAKSYWYESRTIILPRLAADQLFNAMQKGRP